MLSHIFYHSTTRKYISAFGSIFDEIVVRRYDKDKNEVQSFTVPIAYGPKQKWLMIMNQDPDNRSVSLLLPRIGFEITSLRRDPSRKLNNIIKNSNVSDDKNKLLSQFVPTPYLLNFELYVMSKNADDACQIVEQILPFFNDDFNFTMDLIPELKQKFDIRVNLLDQSISDAYDGDFNARRVLMWTFSFEMQCYYFGPITKSAQIKRVQLDLHSLSGSNSITSEEMDVSGRISRILVSPGLTVDGKPTTVKEESINYRDIKEEDDYGFIEEYIDFYDGKKFNPVTGDDEP